MNISKIGLLICAALVLNACAKREEILKGKRLDSRANPITEKTNQNVALKLPSPRVNTAWTQRGGTPSHNIHHPSLNTEPALIWRANIGKGETRKQRLSSQPVINNGRIFTLDTNGLIRAFNLAGNQIWETQINPDIKIRGDISGGGLAIRGDRLAVTTGAGYAALLNARNGEIRWRHRLNAAANTAPALGRDRMIIVTGDNKALALDLDNGRIRWQQSSIGASAGILGNGSPAISGAYAIVPYNSGEIQGITIKNGLQAWSHVLTGDRIGIAKNIFDALSGDPVVSGNIVYVGSISGRMAAFDRRSGLRIWTAGEGAIGNIIPAGNSLFVISDEGDLKRLSRSDGSMIWHSTLPQFKNEKRKRDNIAHFGPVLAGGQLWVASSDGLLRGFNPQNGKSTRNITLRSGAASAPVVADSRLFVITQDGQLNAFR